METMVKTAWLANRLGVSVKTLERMRAAKSDQIPPHFYIGRSIRYDMNQVEAWLANRLTACIRQEKADE